MMKILVAAPTPFDATSFYRAFGIFPDLSKKMDIEIVPFTGGITWAQIGSFDVIYLQRPSNPKLLELAQYAKQHLKVKIWTDFDDNLFDLPPESRAFFEYDLKIKSVMHSILLLSDVVTVSTPALKEAFGSLGVKNIRVIPNALNDEWHKIAPFFNGTSKNIAWRGSETHVADILYFAEPMLSAMEKIPDYTWHFMGYNPFAITHVVPFYAPGIHGESTAKIWIHKAEDNLIYHDKLRKIAPKIMHVPLIPNSLNQAKSNIAWIEATFAGAATIAPAWAEWKKPGVITYSNQEEYEQLLTSTDVDFSKCWKDSAEYISKNLLLSEVNFLRRDMLEQLLQGEPFEESAGTVPLIDEVPIQPELI